VSWKSGDFPTARAGWLTETGICHLLLHSQSRTREGAKRSNTARFILSLLFDDFDNAVSLLRNPLGISSQPAQKSLVSAQKYDKAHLINDNLQNMVVAEKIGRRSGLRRLSKCGHCIHIAPYQRNRGATNTTLSHRDPGRALLPSQGLL
jgi:hypothetical protein